VNAGKQKSTGRNHRLGLPWPKDPRRPTAFELLISLLQHSAIVAGPPRLSQVPRENWKPGRADSFPFTGGIRADSTLGGLAAGRRPPPRGGNGGVGRVSGVAGRCEPPGRGPPLFSAAGGAAANGCCRGDGTAPVLPPPLIPIRLFPLVLQASQQHPLPFASSFDFMPVSSHFPCVIPSPSWRPSLPGALCYPWTDPGRPPTNAGGGPFPAPRMPFIGLAIFSGRAIRDRRS